MTHMALEYESEIKEDGPQASMELTWVRKSHSKMTPGLDGSSTSNLCQVGGPMLVTSILKGPAILVILEKLCSKTYCDMTRAIKLVVKVVERLDISQVKHPSQTHLILKPSNNIRLKT